jgi:hypothetical protein
MDAECDYAKPEEVLHAFWKQMNQWELESYRSMPSVSDFDAMNQWWPRIADARSRIFDRYCTNKKRPSSDRPSVGNPPAYDPAQERIVEVVPTTSTRLEIKTETSTHPPKSLTYILMKKSGKWLLDGKQFAGWDGKIVKAHL